MIMSARCCPQTSGHYVCKEQFGVFLLFHILRGCRIIFHLNLYLSRRSVVERVFVLAPRSSGPYGTWLQILITNTRNMGKDTEEPRDGAAWLVFLPGRLWPSTHFTWSVDLKSKGNGTGRGCMEHSPDYPVNTDDVETLWQRRFSISCTAIFGTGSCGRSVGAFLRTQKWDTMCSWNWIL